MSKLKRTNDPRPVLRLASWVAVGAVLLCLLTAPSMSQATGRSVRNERYRGLVTPSRQVELMAPLEEILQEIVIEEGQRVEQGALLARLDDRLQTVVVEAARLRAGGKAEVRLAVADLEEAKDNLVLINTAFERGAASDIEARRARTLAVRAEAAHLHALENRALAEVNLKLEERRLSRYRITAPFDGLVVRVVAESGALLTSQDAILVLADHDVLEARLDLPADLYGQLEVGRTYSMFADEPVNAEIFATLKSFDPQIDNASRTFRCTFSIENEGARLPAGFSVYLAWPPTEPDPMTVRTPTGGAEFGQPDR